MPYKAIFFDLDGVLTTNHSGGSLTCAYLADKFQIDIQEIQAVYKLFGKRLGSGEITYEPFIAALSEQLSIHVSMDDLEGAFVSAPKNEEMFSLVSELKQRGLRVGVITDNDKQRFESLNNRLELSEVFDSLTVSSHVGSYKDSADIFNHALTSLGVKAEEAVFIDNKESNLNAAQDLGMTTFLFDDSKNDVAELKNKLNTLLS